MLSNLPGLLNVALCTVIVLTLFFYRRRDSRHKPLMSWLAWLLMLLYAFAPLSYLCGRPLAANWLAVGLNRLFCVLVIRARGNVSKSLYYEDADMKSKDEIFDEVLGKEGGYVNHPDDKGGPTKWGITEKVARAHGYQGDMRDLTREQALEILEADYWFIYALIRWPHYPLIFAGELCDTGVNMRAAPLASKMLQRWLNVFNLQGKLFPDMDADGRIGPRTINALRTYLQKRGKDGELVMLKALNCTQGDRYLELAEKREANESFVYG